MHKPSYTYRLEIEKGMICLITKAVWKDRETDCLKTFDDGSQMCRHLYYNMYGYFVCFVNERKVSYGYSTYENEEEFIPCENIPFLYGKNYSPRNLTEEEKEMVISLYPNLKYILNNVEVPVSEIIQTITVWLKYPKIELLLKSGLKNLAYSKSFLQKKSETQIKILKFIKENPWTECLKFSDIQTIMKWNICEDEYKRYKYALMYGRIGYDAYRYIEKNYSVDYEHISLYKDYYSLLVKSMHKKNDPYWRYPKNLREMHGRLLAEKKEIERFNEVQKMQKKNYQYQKAVEKFVSLELEKNISGYSVFIPKTTMEFVPQAESLHQCIISCNYAQKVIDRKCILVFIQKNNKPVATAEIKVSDFSLGQFYADEQSRNIYPSPKVKDAFNVWFNSFRKSVSEKIAV